MTFVVKNRTLPGSPFLAEYACEICELRFEQLVQRDTNGDAPARVRCPECLEELDEEAATAELVISAPKVAFWTRKPVPIGYASKSDDKDPRALDTEDLATGKLTQTEWRRKQAKITAERRYQRRLKAGRIAKRIQVG